MSVWGCGWKICRQVQNLNTSGASSGGYTKSQVSRSSCRFFSKSSPLTRPVKESSSTNYCLDLVRKHDYEMFLCTLLIPDPEIRTRVMALRAFNTEIALIRDQVSLKETGLARLTFWRDAISQLYLTKQTGNKDLKLVPRQPTVLELSRVILEKEISKKWFTNLVDGRERVMSDAPFKNLAELEAYSDQTVTPILFMTFEMLGIKNVDVDHAASHLGKAIGITNFIRSIPFNAQRRRALIPQDLVMKYGLSQESFIRDKEKEKVKELVFEIASQANSHYQKAKSFKNSVEKQVLPIFLSGVPTEIYLKRLQAVHFDPYDASLTKRYGLLPWHLYFKKLTKNYY